MLIAYENNLTVKLEIKKRNNLNATRSLQLQRPVLRKGL